MRRILIPAVMLAASITLAAPARADDDDPDTTQAQEVCGAYNLGVPPGDIAGDLRRNNPRVNSPTLPYKVFQDLQDCP
jgi:hypothetical protein